MRGFDPHVHAVAQDGGLLLAWNALADAGVVTVRRQDVGSSTAITVALLDAGTTSWFEPSWAPGTR